MKPKDKQEERLWKKYKNPPNLTDRSPKAIRAAKRMWKRVHTKYLRRLGKQETQEEDI